MSAVRSVLLACIFACLAVHVPGIRSTDDLNNDFDDNFRKGVTDAIAIQEPEYDTGRAVEAFKVLQSGSRGVSTEVITELSAGSELVLHFLLDVYKFGRMYRSQVEAVVKRVITVQAWADAAIKKPVRRHLLSVFQSLGVTSTSLGELEKLGAPKITTFLGYFQVTKGDLDSLEEEEAQSDVEAELAEEPLQPDSPVLTDSKPNPNPLQTKLESALAKVGNMTVPREYQNRGEKAWSDLRVAVLRLRGSDLSQELLKNAEGKASMVWEFLLRWGSDRRIFRNQVEEVARVLISSEEWKSVLLNDPKLMEAALSCPALKAIGKELLPAPSPMANCPTEAAPVGEVSRVRILLTRKRLCSVAGRLTSSNLLPSLTRLPPSWAGCGIVGVQWVGAEPYTEALHAATYGFSGVVHAAPYLGKPAPATVMGEPKPAEQVNMPSVSWEFAHRVDGKDNGATGQRDWAQFERFLATDVVPGLRGSGDDVSEEPAIAVVVSDEIIKETFMKRFEWWHGYRSTLCKGLVGGDLPEVIEILYEVIDGQIVAMAERPDGSSNCRPVGHCTCFK